MALTVRLGTRLVSLALAAGALACTVESGAEKGLADSDSAAGDRSNDTGADTGPVEDTAAEARARCLASWSDGVRELDPSGPDTQIHTDVGFDGEHFWFVWNRPNDDSNFDVLAASMACDGSSRLEPFMVSESSENEIDPTLAIHGDQLLMAWTGSSSAGLDIRYRGYGVDGTAAMAATRLSASRAGEPVTGNACLPDLAAFEDRFLLAGSWGHADAPAFQAFALGLTADGTLDGDATDVELDPDVGQTLVDVAVHEGAVELVWQVDSTTSTNPVTRSSTLGQPADSLGSPGARPTVVGAASGVWRAWDDNGGEVLLQAPDGGVTALDLGRGFFHSPQLVAYEDTVMLLVMEVDTSIYNRLRLLKVDEGGVVAEVPLTADAAPSVYEAAVALVDESHAVVVWQQGTSPAFRSYGEWVSWSL